MDPQGVGHHPWDVRCIDATVLARVGNPLPTRNWLSVKRCLWHLQGAAATCAASQRLLLHVGGCAGPPGTRPAPLGSALHRCHGACTCGAPLYPQETAFQLSGAFGTCRARQAPAPQRRHCRCMSADALDPQGLGHNRWDVHCIDATALARVAHPLPTRNWLSVKRCLWPLQGALAPCAARQTLPMHVGGCIRSPGTRPAPL